jgi:hypothetical protein
VFTKHGRKFLIRICRYSSSILGVEYQKMDYICVAISDVPFCNKADHVGYSATLNRYFGYVKQEFSIRANDLFPFLTTICDNMDLLKLAAAPVSQSITESFASVQNWPTDEAIFDFIFKDFFGSDAMDTNLNNMDDRSGRSTDEQAFPF